MTSVQGMFDAGNLPLLKRALDAYALRHRVVAENIANVATEGYRAQKVEFEDLLAQAQDRTIPALRTNPGHLPFPEETGGVPEIVEEDTGFNNGVNDVNVEQEQLALAQNELMYRMATRLLHQKYQGLRMAITGRTQ